MHGVAAALAAGEHDTTLTLHDTTGGDVGAVKTIRLKAFIKGAAEHILEVNEVEEEKGGGALPAPICIFFAVVGKFCCSLG